MNVQQLIIKGIKEQLFLNNYLVLPGFGGFVLRLNPAHFSGAGTFIVPPSKTISFNAQLKQNDGLLALWLQKQLSCNAAEALAHLNDFSSFCSGILSSRRRLSLDTIGFFYLDFENNVCFEPQQDSNFLTKSFGLAPVSVKELPPLEKPEEIKKETVFVDRPAVAERAVNEPKITRRYTRLIVPAALMILFLSGLLLFVSTTKISGPHMAGLFSASAKGVYSPVNYTPLALQKSNTGNEAYVADANGIAVLNLENNKTLAVKALNTLVNTPLVSISKPAMKSHNPALRKFEIVLGCFTVEENAGRLVKKLSKQNITAFVAEKNSKGMYIVSNGSFENKEEALAELDKLKGVYPKAWLKKPD